MRRAIRNLAALLALGLATLGLPVAVGVGTAAAAASAAKSERASDTAQRNVPGGVAARSSDKLDLEDHSEYSDEYIFGLTKGVMRSTLSPALKPVLLIVTVPLDLVLLPFAAIGGLFR